MPDDKKETEIFTRMRTTLHTGRYLSLHEELASLEHGGQKFTLIHVMGGGVALKAPDCVIQVSLQDLAAALMQARETIDVLRRGGFEKEADTL